MQDMVRFSIVDSATLSIWTATSRDDNTRTQCDCSKRGLTLASLEAARESRHGIRIVNFCLANLVMSSSLWSLLVSHDRMERSVTAMMAFSASQVEGWRVSPEQEEARSLELGLRKGAGDENSNKELNVAWQRQTLSGPPSPWRLPFRWHRSHRPSTMILLNLSAV